MKQTFLALCALAIAVTIGWLVFGGSTVPEPGPRIATWDETDIPEDDPDAISVEVGDEDEASSDRGVVEFDDVADTGFVALSVRGRVVDTASNPVPGARVEMVVSRRRYASDRDGISRVIVTDESGAFEFRGPGPQRSHVQVVVSHDAFAPHLDIHEFRDRNALELGDIVLGTGGTLIGAVVDEQGNPIPTAEVSIEPTTSNRFGWSPLRQKIEKTLTTDARGTYHIAHLTPADYQVSATVRGHVPGRLPRPISIEEDVELRAKDIVLRAGAIVTGIVFDANDEPVAGATATVHQDGTSRNVRTTPDGRFEFAHLSRASFDLRVRAEGHRSWEREGIDPATDSDLTVRLAPGLTLRGLVVDATHGEPVETFAVRGERIRGLEDANRKAEEQAMRAMRERIQRTRANANDPATEAELLERLMQAERRMKEAMERREQRDVSRRRRRPADLGPPRSQPGGTFEIGGLDEGIYVLFVHSPAHQLFQSEEIRLTADTEGIEHRFTLHPGATAAGTVVDPEGNPVADARVELRRIVPADDPRSARSAIRRDGPLSTEVASTSTDEGGAFTFRGVEPSQYELRVRRSGFTTTRTSPFDLLGERSFEVVLGPASRVFGRVSGVPRGRESEVRVIAFAGFGTDTIREGRIDPEDGSYSIEIAKPGGYLVSAFVGDRRSFIARHMRSPGTPLQPTVTVAAGQEYRIDLAAEIPALGSLEGHVHRDGAVAGDVQLRLRRNDGTRGGPVPQTFTEPDGSFRFDEVEAGDYLLLVYGTRTNSRTIVSSRPVSIVDGTTSSAQITMTIGSLDGSIQTPDQAAPRELVGRVYVLPGATVLPDDLRAYLRDHPSMQGRISNGEYAIEEVTTGPAVVIVDLRGRERSHEVVTIVDGENRIDLVGGTKKDP